MTGIDGQLFLLDIMDAGDRRSWRATLVARCNASAYVRQVRCARNEPLAVCSCITTALVIFVDRLIISYY